VTRAPAWVRYAVKCLSLPLETLVRLLPRDKNTWVFGAWFGLRFADNSKYLFLHVLRRDAHVTAIWLARSPQARSGVREAGGTAVHPFSPAGIYYQLRAGVVVISVSLDDVGWLWTAGARIVQLWHGTPLKRIGRDDDRFDRPPASGMRWIWWLRNWFLRREWADYWLFPAPAPEVADVLGGAFEIPPDRMPVLGYPRNDILLDSQALLDARVEVNRALGLPPDDGRPLVLYLPTHRQEGRSDGPLLPFGPGSLETVRDLLESQDAIFVFRKHFYHSQTSGSPSSNRFFDVSRSDIDTQLLLGVASVLVTDISSCFFDYLLLDRPIVFLTADLEEFTRTERGLYYPVESVMPGRRVESLTAFTEGIRSSLRDPMEHSEPRAALRARTYTRTDRSSSELVFEEIRKRLWDEPDR